MSDAWEEIQAIKSKRNSLRERLEKRKKERQDILGVNLTSASNSPAACNEIPPSISVIAKDELKIKLDVVEDNDEDTIKADPELEKEVLKTITEVTLQIPITSIDLVSSLKKSLERHASHRTVCNLLQKFATQKLITIKDIVKDGRNVVEISFVEHTKLNAMITEEAKPVKEEVLKRKREDSPVKIEEDDKKKKEKKDPKTNDIMVILLQLLLYLIVIIVFSFKFYL